MSNARKLAKVFYTYGIFLIVVGLVGYLSNPEKAKTALLSGSLFGGASIVLGYFTNQAKTWTLKAGTVMLAMLLGVFTWRSWASWSAVAAGQSDKLTAAVLITLMWTASAWVLIWIFGNKKRH